MSQKKKILIVEDDKRIAELVDAFLKAEKYATIMARDGQEALSLFTSEKPDLVLLDLMLPRIDGIELCKKIRTESDVPVLVISARSTEDDKEEGFRVGADDYLTKPFSLREMTSRVRALLRRSLPVEGLVDRMEFDAGNLVIDSIRQKVLAAGKELSLTPSEYKILFVLARRPGRVFERSELLEKLRPLEFEGTERTIDTHVRNLRMKLEENPSYPRFIKTVHGVGYRFEG